MRTWSWLLFVCFACTTEVETVSITVNLRTDAIAGVDFDRVRIRVLTPGSVFETVGEAETSNTFGDDFLIEDNSVATFRVPPDTYRIGVEIMQGTAVFAETNIVSEIDNDTVYTARIERGCNRSIRCPEEGDSPDATACFNGGCVAPECLDDNSESTSCENVRCRNASDCVPKHGCATGICDAGRCLFEDTGICGANAFCDANSGCRELDTLALQVERCASTSDCPTFDHQSASCDETSTCDYACDAGFADCDGNLENGCEVELGTADNCSVCGDACAWGYCHSGTCDDPASVQIQDDAVCALTAATGRLYCWGDGALGVDEGAEPRLIDSSISSFRMKSNGLYAKADFATEQVSVRAYRGCDESHTPLQCAHIPLAWQTIASTESSTTNINTLYTDFGPEPFNAINETISFRDNYSFCHIADDSLNCEFAASNTVLPAYSCLSPIGAPPTPPWQNYATKTSLLFTDDNGSALNVERPLIVNRDMVMASVETGIDAFVRVLEPGCGTPVEKLERVRLFDLDRAHDIQLISKRSYVGRRGDIAFVVDDLLWFENNNLVAGRYDVEALNNVDTSAEPNDESAANIRQTFDSNILAYAAYNSGNADARECVALENGDVQCWGLNNGLLGDGTFAARAAPVSIGELKAIDIAMGDEKTCVITRDGNVWCWGHGFLGHGTRDSASPVRVLIPHEHGTPSSD